MSSFLQFDPKTSFRLFSGQHLLTIGIIILLVLLLFIFRNNLSEQRIRRTIRYTLLILLTVTYAAYHLWLVYEKAWSLKSDLPLQLSDLVIILAIVMLFSIDYRIFQFMYFAGLGSSLQAIVTPDLGRYSFPHFRYIEFFVVHGGVVIACLFMVFAYKYKPSTRSLWLTALIINLYAAIVYFLNKQLGSNFLYLMKKPDTPSLLNYLGPWPWYLLSLEVVMIVSFYLLYSPFWIKRKRERSN